MELSFLGAAREVTGSAHLLKVGNKSILIDCGMRQGAEIYENQEICVKGSEVDAVLLTHAHIDHSGLVPLLVKSGFKGFIISTSATFALCDIMLRDSAHIQEQEAMWQNKKLKRKGEVDEIQPLYTMADALIALSKFKQVEYEQKIKVTDGVEAVFHDAGHLLGSSIIEVVAVEDKETRRIVFSGDLGPSSKPLLNPPVSITKADYVLIESTYGDRVREQREDFMLELAGIIQRVLDRQGNLVVPAFAVGRTQELLYFIRQIKKLGLVIGHGDFPVIVDSPLAIEATTVYTEQTKGYYDEEAMEIVQSGENPIGFSGLVRSVTEGDSRLINTDTTPKIIISASGMCEAGRIRHHLKHNLWQARNAVLFVGYQCEGTLGRLLIDGAKKVKLFGDEIMVAAEIIKVEGLSSHADRNGLIAWLSKYEEKPRRVFVVHGENSTAENFASYITENLLYRATAPYYYESYDLITNEQSRSGAKLKLKKLKKMEKYSVSFQKLLVSLQKLTQTVQSYKNYSNYEIRKFTSQIEALNKVWKIKDK